jgi:hypothetical protein
VPRTQPPQDPATGTCVGSCSRSRRTNRGPDLVIGITYPPIASCPAEIQGSEELVLSRIRSAPALGPCAQLAYCPSAALQPRARSRPIAASETPASPRERASALPCACGRSHGARARRPRVWGRATRLRDGTLTLVGWGLTIRIDPMCQRDVVESLRAAWKSREVDGLV